MRLQTFLAAFAVLASGCGSDATSVSSELLTKPPTVASSRGDCESIPLAQFNLGGVTYTARQITDTVIEADLGDVLGVQVGDIPQGLLRCEAVQLENGQGSLGPGAPVYVVRGVDPSISIAGEVGAVYLKLYA